MEGVDFGAIDSRPAHHFFLIVAPPLEVSGQYLPVLGKGGPVREGGGRADQACLAEIRSRVLRTARREAGLAARGRTLLKPHDASLFRDEHPANGGASPVDSHLNEVHTGRNLLAMSVPTVPMGFVAAGGGVLELEQRQSFSAGIP